MTIPDYQTLMLPLLQAIGDGDSHRLADLIEELAETFQLSQQGATLARLMIEHNVGVSVSSSYLIKRMDSDYFTEP